MHRFNVQTGRDRVGSQNWARMALILLRKSHQLNPNIIENESVPKKIPTAIVATRCVKDNVLRRLPDMFVTALWHKLCHANDFRLRGIVLDWRRGYPPPMLMSLTDRRSKLLPVVL